MEFLEAINHFYSQMSLREFRLLREREEYAGLSYNSLLYLDIISHRQNCTVSSLSALLGLTKSAVTMKIQELAKKGAIIKTQSKADRRVYYLSPAPRIQEVYQSYDELFAQIEERLRKTYSPQQLDLFCKILSDIADCPFEDSTHA